MRKMWLFGALCLFVPALAGAQTKISGVALCAPPNPAHQLTVGDKPGHAYGVAQGTCTWTQPWEIAGVKNTQGIGTQIQEIMGDTMKVRGTFVDSMANGDKASYNFEFTLATKTDGPHAINHKWELVGGTGKLAGVKGKGTCIGTPAGSDGSLNYACEGEYTLPKP